jgi:hypothetical protein
VRRCAGASRGKRPGRGVSPQGFVNVARGFIPARVGAGIVPVPHLAPLPGMRSPIPVGAGGGGIIFTRSPEHRPARG